MNMKRKCLLPIMLAVAIMSTVVGCSSKKDAQTAPPAEEEVVEMADTEETDMQNAGVEENDVQKTGTEGDNASEESTLTGTIDEIKDFMFVVVDSEDRAYALSFEGEKPKGLDEVKVGDEVKVTYTGVLSEVDHFEGKIISVEKVK